MRGVATFVSILCRAYNIYTYILHFCMAMEIYLYYLLLPQYMYANVAS